MMGEARCQLLKRTIVDIADRHTTLYYLRDPAPAGPLPFGSEADYVALQELLSNQNYVAYSTAAAPTAGEPRAVRALQRAFDREKFWKWYTQTTDYRDFPQLAWAHSIPIEASLSVRLECVPIDPFPCSVRPVLRVLLLPFGWSIWLNVLLTGDHSLSDLSSVLHALCTGKIFRLSSSAQAPAQHVPADQPVTLSEAFEDISRRVRHDAFELQSQQWSTPERLVVTTVMEQKHEFLSCRGLSLEQKALLSRIVHPDEGPLPSIEHEPTMIQQLKNEGVNNFVIADKFGRFVWLWKLLQSGGRNQQHLRCYHNNTFRSFILGWHQLGLLMAVLVSSQPASARLQSLARCMLAKLDTPDYESVSVKFFSQEGIVVRGREAARAVLS